MADEATVAAENQTQAAQTTSTVDPAIAAAQAADAAEAAKVADLQKTAVESYKAEQAKNIPEAYKFDLPEGRTLDTKAAELAAPVFKELGLSQEAANKIVGIHASLVEAQDKALQDQIAAQNVEWVKEATTAKDIDSGAAQKAFSKFGTPELNKYLKDSGLGNHPGLLRMMTKVGKTITEDTVIPGQGESEAPSAKRLYDHPSSSTLT